MAVQLVTKGGTVIAYHPMYQDISMKYPASEGFEITEWDGDFQPLGPDPRPAEIRGRVPRPTTVQRWVARDGRQYDVWIDGNGELKTTLVGG